MKKAKQNQGGELGTRAEVSRLVKLLGITRISGRRVGHYNLNNLNKIPEKAVFGVYEDLTQIQRRLGYKGE